MIKVLLLSLLLSFSLSAAEVPSAVIQRLVGTVLFEGQPVKLGDVLDKPGTIETREKSLVQLKITKWDNQISIGPASKMILNFTDEKKYTLEEGLCRWRSALREAAGDWGSEGKGKIHTKNVSLGIRGTDFLLKRFSLFNETEIIMFDGEVQMENLEKPENKITVKKGQWGGLGGRYGKTINPPLDLPQSVLNSAAARVDIK